jgi:hypothetical protein
MRRRPQPDDMRRDRHDAVEVVNGLVIDGDADCHGHSSRYGATALGIFISFSCIEKFTHRKGAKIAKKRFYTQFRRLCVLCAFAVSMVSMDEL